MSQGDTPLQPSLCIYKYSTKHTILYTSRYIQRVFDGFKVDRGFQEFIVESSQGVYSRQKVSVRLELRSKAKRLSSKVKVPAKLPIAYIVDLMITVELEVVCSIYVVFKSIQFVEVRVIIVKMFLGKLSKTLVLSIIIILLKESTSFLSFKGSLGNYYTSKEVLLS